jgi:hypothetical protein
MPSPQPPPPPTGLRPATRLPGSSVTLIISAWLLWAFFMSSYAVDLLIAWFGAQNAASGPPPIPPDPSFTFVLAVVSAGHCFVILLVRWLFLHFVIHPARAGSGTWVSAFMAFFGLGTIYTLAKSIEIYGFMLWFGSASWPHYFGFAVPSVLLMLIHTPLFVLTRRITHRVLPAASPQGSVLIAGS